jgi:hypothetical protein
MIKGLMKPWDRMARLLIVTIGFCWWYYLTCKDFTTWTYTIWAAPAMALAIGLGLKRWKGSLPTLATLLGALVLMVTGTLWLNAGVLDNEVPIARAYYQAVQQIPDGSVVVTNIGGWEGMGVYYALSEGKQIDQIYFIWTSEEKRELYQLWQAKQCPIKGEGTQEQVAQALRDGRQVWVLEPLMPEWAKVITTDPASAIPVKPSPFANEQWVRVTAIQVGVTVNQEPIPVK